MRQQELSSWLHRNTESLLLILVSRKKTLIHSKPVGFVEGAPKRSTWDVTRTALEAGICLCVKQMVVLTNALHSAGASSILVASGPRNVGAEIRMDQRARPVDASARLAT